MNRVVAERYELIRPIGEGGMGTVYEARHVVTHKTCALKLFRRELAMTQESASRFLREARAPAAIDHPGITDAVDAGVEPDGTPFIAMELLVGESLRDRMRGAKMSSAAGLDMLEQVLEVLAAAHAKGFVHRDLKPENIFIARARDGSQRVKLLDFGIAHEVEAGRLTQTGMSIGTPHYMSPEQWKGATTTPATDVWAFGVLLYEAVAGKPPFDGPTAGAITIQACTEPHLGLEVHVPAAHGNLARLVDACLQKEPLARPPDAGEVLRVFRSVRAGTPVPSRPATSRPEPMTPIARTAAMPSDPAPPSRPVASVAPAQPVASHVPVAVPKQQSKGGSGALIIGCLLLTAFGAVAAAVAGVALLTVSGASEEVADAPSPAPIPRPVILEPIPSIEEPAPLPPPPPLPAPVPEERDVEPVPPPTPTTMTSRRTRPTPMRTPAPAPMISTPSQSSPPSTGLPNTPSRSDTVRAMRSIQGDVVQCAAGQSGMLTLRVTVAGSTGRVTSAQVTGAFAGTPVGACVARVARRIQFSRFARPTFSVSYPYRL